MCRLVYRITCVIEWSSLPLHDCIMEVFFYIFIFFNIFRFYTISCPGHAIFGFLIEFINICAQNTDQLNIFGLVYKINNTLKWCSPSSVFGKSHWCYTTFQYHFGTCYLTLLGFNLWLLVIYSNLAA